MVVRASILPRILLLKNLARACPGRDLRAEDVDGRTKSDQVRPRGSSLVAQDRGLATDSSSPDRPAVSGGRCYMWDWISAAQRSRIGRISSAPADDRLTTTRATPSSRQCSSRPASSE